MNVWPILKVAIVLVVGIMIIFAGLCVAHSHHQKRNDHE